jgi:hypothetical protein
MVDNTVSRVDDTATDSLLWENEVLQCHIVFRVVWERRLHVTGNETIKAPRMEIRG